jgi:hypothetical protein
MSEMLSSRKTLEKHLNHPLKPGQLGRNVITKQIVQLKK